MLQWVSQPHELWAAQIGLSWLKLLKEDWKLVIWGCGL